MSRELFSQLARWEVEGRPYAIATVVRTRGSTPQQLGAKLVLSARTPPSTRGEGIAEEIVGTVGGGAVEAAVIDALRARLAKPDAGAQSELFQLDLGKDLGMCCGGSMEFLLEVFSSRPRLLLFGAGHVALPLAQLARSLDFEVHVIDARAELNTDARFSGCHRHVIEIDEAAERLDTRAHDWVMIVTHDHHLDERALELFAQRPHQYIGVIGSQRKILKITQRLRARKVTLDYARVYAPVGLALGALSPAEIAISIAAEWVALRRAQLGEQPNEQPSAHLRLDLVAREAEATQASSRS